MPRKKGRICLANLRQGSKHDATPVATTADDDVNEANATINGEEMKEISDDSDGEDFCEESAGQIVYCGAKITNWFPVIKGAVASTQGEAISKQCPIYNFFLLKLCFTARFVLHLFPPSLCPRH